MRELENFEFRQAAGLFQPLIAFQPFCGAVVAGIYPGRVWVDSPTQPTIAFMVTRGNWAYLAGEMSGPDSTLAFNQALEDGRILDNKVETVILTYHPPGLKEALAELFAPHPVLFVKRRVYIARKLEPDLRPALTGGYRVATLDSDLANQPGIEIPADLKETLSEWQNNKHPYFQDFGCVILTGSQVAAWATVDGVAGKQGDVGFFT